MYTPEKVAWVYTRKTFAASLIAFLDLFDVVVIFDILQINSWTKTV